MGLFRPDRYVRESVEKAKTNMLCRLDNPGWRILNAGGGSRNLQEQLKKATIVSLDIKNPGDLGIVGDIHSIPFPDNSFEGVICTQVLEHVADPLKACSEMYRVLTGNGLILLTIPFVWKEHPSPEDYWRFTRDGGKHLLSQAGFVDIETHSNGGYFISLNYLLRNLGTIVMGRYFGYIYHYLYKPVGVIFFYLDKLFPHPEFSINNSVYGRKEEKEL